MYNLFVTAMEGAWDQPFYEYHRSRFLEYTNDKISNFFENLTNNNIKTLKSYPSLFAYEGTESDVRIGFLKSIKERGRNLLIEYEFFEEIPAIPFASIEPITPLLDIRDWEMNRTHWAVKDENLFERLISASLLESDVIDTIEMPEKSEIITKSKTNKPKVTTVQGFIGKVLSVQKKKIVRFFIADIQIRKNTSLSLHYSGKTMRAITYTWKTNIFFTGNSLCRTHPTFHRMNIHLIDWLECNIIHYRHGC